MNSKQALRAAYFVLLLLGTLTIVWRRWALDQVPSQIPAGAVFAILVVNGCVLALQVYRWVPQAGLTKMDKN